MSVPGPNLEHPPRLLTADEVAERLNVSLSLVYKLRRQGRLRCIQIGSLYRFHPDDLLAFISERT